MTPYPVPFCVRCTRTIREVEPDDWTIVRDGLACPGCVTHAEQRQGAVPSRISTVALRCSVGEEAACGATLGTLLTFVRCNQDRAVSEFLNLLACSPHGRFALCHLLISALLELEAEEEDVT